MTSQNQLLLRDSVIKRNSQTVNIDGYEFNLLKRDDIIKNETGNKINRQKLYKTNEQRKFEYELFTKFR